MKYPTWVSPPKKPCGAYTFNLLMPNPVPKIPPKRLVVSRDSRVGRHKRRSK